MGIKLDLPSFLERDGNRHRRLKRLPVAPCPILPPQPLFFLLLDHICVSRGSNEEDSEGNLCSSLTQTNHLWAWVGNTLLGFVWPSVTLIGVFWGCHSPQDPSYLCCAGIGFQETLGSEWCIKPNMDVYPSQYSESSIKLPFLTPSSGDGEGVVQGSANIFR